MHAFVILLAAGPVHPVYFTLKWMLVGHADRLDLQRPQRGQPLGKCAYFVDFRSWRWARRPLSLAERLSVSQRVRGDFRVRAPLSRDAVLTHATCSDVGRYEFSAHVPMLLRWPENEFPSIPKPNIPRGTTLKPPLVSELRDIFPTFLHATGVEGLVRLCSFLFSNQKRC